MKLFRIALVRPVGKFEPESWDDLPQKGVIVRLSQKLVNRAYGEGYVFTKNTLLRQAGRRECAVLIRQTREPHVGAHCTRTLLYDVA